MLIIGRVFIVQCIEFHLVGNNRHGGVPVLDFTTGNQFGMICEYPEIVVLIYFSIPGSVVETLKLK